MREPLRKFGLKGAQFQAYGATPYKTDNFRDQAQYFLYSHKVKIKARVDADL